MGKRVTITNVSNVIFNVTYQLKPDSKPIVYDMTNGIVKSASIDKEFLFESFPWYNKVFKEQLNIITNYTSSFVATVNDRRSLVTIVSAGYDINFIINIETRGKKNRMDNIVNLYNVFKWLYDNKKTYRAAYDSEFDEVYEPNGIKVTAFNADNNQEFFDWLGEIIIAMRAMMKVIAKVKVNNKLTNKLDDKDCDSPENDPKVQLV